MSAAGEFGVSGQGGEHVAGHFDFGDEGDVAGLGVGDEFAEFGLGIEERAVGLAVSLVAVAGPWGFGAAGADFGEARVLADLDAPALVVGEVELDVVEFVAGGEVDEFLEEIERHEVAGDIEEEAAVGEAGLVDDLEAGEGPRRVGCGRGVGGRGRTDGVDDLAEGDAGVEEAGGGSGPEEDAVGVDGEEIAFGADGGDERGFEREVDVIASGGVGGAGQGEAGELAQLVGEGSGSGFGAGAGADEGIGLEWERAWEALELGGLGEEGEGLVWGGWGGHGGVGVGFEDEDLEGVEGEAERLAGVGGPGRLGGVIGPRAAKRIRGGGSRGQFEGAAHVQEEVAGAVGGVAEHEDAFAWGPGGIAVGLGAGGVAGDPVGIDQDIGVGAGPLGGFGEEAPVVVGEAAGLDIEFLEAGAGAEEGADVVFEACGVEGGVAGGAFAGVGDALGHEGVEGVEGGFLDDVAVGFLVAVGEPLFLFWAGAGVAHIAALAPEGIGEAEPEGGGPGAGGEVDEEVGVGVAEFEHESAHGIGIADVVGAAGGVHAGGDAIEFEVVDAVALDHVEAGLFKGGVVAWAGEGEAGGVGFEPLGGAEAEALFTGFAVAAEGGEPDAEAGLVGLAGLGERGKAAGETGVELPKRLGVIPTVVEDHRIHGDLMGADEVLADLMDGVEAIGFVEVEGAPGDVVPGVVVEERSVRMGALAFDVVEEGAAHLAVGRHPDDEADREGFVGCEGGGAGEAAAPAARRGAWIWRVPGVGILDTQEPVARDGRHAIHGAHGLGEGERVGQPSDFVEGGVGLEGGEREFLAEVTRAVVEDGAPGGLPAAVFGT